MNQSAYRVTVRGVVYNRVSRVELSKLLVQDPEATVELLAPSKSECPEFDVLGNRIDWNKMYAGPSGGTPG